MKTLQTLSRKARNFARRPLFEQAWFIPVWLLLGICRFLILVLHFRRMAPWLGKQAGIAPWIPLLDPASEARARSVARIVQMAAGYTPWESNCFPQALAARILLGIYGVPYSLFFGVSRDPAGAEMAAHAWVVSGRVSVTGGASFGKFAVVGCFVAPHALAMRDQA